MAEFEEKYKGIRKSLANELAVDETKYFREDLPVPFCGLLVYPAKVRDYERFMDAISCLTLDKNVTGEGIRMTNLEYLLAQTQIKEKNEGIHWSFRLNTLLEVCFHLKNGYKCPKCGEVFDSASKEIIDAIQEKQERLQRIIVEHPEYLQTEEGTKKIKDEVGGLECPHCKKHMIKDANGNEVPDKQELYAMFVVRKDDQGKVELVLDHDKVITSKDFDRFRSIVLFQNMADYRDESWVDPSIKADHEEKLRLQQKSNKLHASLERKVVCLSVASNYKIAEIYDMPIRKFTMALSVVDDLINYKIMKTATMSGFVSLPKGKTIEHWIYKEDKDLYGDDYKTMQSVAAAVS